MFYKSEEINLRRDKKKLDSRPRPDHFFKNSRIFYYFLFYYIAANTLYVTPNILDTSVQPAVNILMAAGCNIPQYFLNQTEFGSTGQFCSCSFVLRDESPHA